MYPIEECRRLTRCRSLLFYVVEEGHPPPFSCGEHTSSHFGLEPGDQRLGHGVLSRAHPARPIEGKIPASSRPSPSARAVYCVPLSEWSITPEGEFLLHRAILRASTTNSTLR
jgi:hypothetical protein